MQLLVETAVESGLRWGELTELRIRDLSPVTRVLTMSRKVIEVNPKFEPGLLLLQSTLGIAAVPMPAPP